MAVLIGVFVGFAVVITLPRGPRTGLARWTVPTSPPPTSPSSSSADEGWLRRGRWLWASLAGVGAALVLGGPLAAPAGIGTALTVGVVASRIEPRAVRVRRDEVRRDLPHVVTLLGAALRSGAAPAAAIVVVCRALPGAAGDRLAPIASRIELGADAYAIWSSLSTDPELGPLGRVMARTHRTGAPVVSAIERLGEELARRGRLEVEDRARAVGVRAAVPLCLCLLPSFVLLGIVPLAVGLASTIV